MRRTAEAELLESSATSTYGEEVDDDEGVSMDENEKKNGTEQRGRLRLQWPTFRGSAVGWGIAAVFWLSCAAQSLVGIVRDGGTSLLGGLVLGALVFVGVVCVVGTVATIRHPRPAPPATDR